jgi:hypothetical protein
MHNEVILPDGLRIPRRNSAALTGPCPRHTVGQPERRIVLRKHIKGVTYKYHATKGWRRERAKNWQPQFKTKRCLIVLR